VSTAITATLERLFDPVGRCLTPEAARALVELRADEEFQARLDELADKNTAGALSPEEGAEYDLYLSALSVVTVLQSQARRRLASADN